MKKLKKLLALVSLMILLSLPLMGQKYRIDSTANTTWKTELSTWNEFQPTQPAEGIAIFGDELIIRVGNKTSTYAEIYSMGNLVEGALCTHFYSADGPAGEAYIELEHIMYGSFTSVTIFIKGFAVRYFFSTEIIGKEA